MKITAVTGQGSVAYSALLTDNEIADFANITDPEATTLLRGISNGVLEHMERDLGRSFIPVNIDLPINCEEHEWLYGHGRKHWGSFKLPNPPLVSIEYVKWVEWDGTEHTIASDNYAILTDCEPGVLKFTGDENLYPDTIEPKGMDSLKIRYRAGYASGEFPEGLKLIAKRIIATHAENPENTIAGIDESVLLLPPELANSLELYRILDFDIEFGV